MAPRQSLRAFLASARSALAAPPSKRSTPLTFVMGNESADLDSLCSALLLAYFRTNTPPHTLHIPLCNIPREDLTLRPEFTAVLRDAAATPDDVITLSELPGAEDLRPEDTRFLLVDHNVMAGRLGKAYGRRVFGCVDHHKDEGEVPRDAELRVIETAGSCASLVISQCRKAWDELSAASSSEEGRRVDSQIAHLALAPILIDTTKLTNPHKTSDLDIDIVKYLESKLVPAVAFQREGFYAKVAELKRDIATMSIRDVLRKDYKEWSEDSTGLKLGTSTAPRNLTIMVEKAGGPKELVRELEAWGGEKELDVVAVLTAFTEEGQFKRELLVLGRTATGSQIAREFEREFGETLKLSDWRDGMLDGEGEGSEKQGWRRCWRQGALECSRKQVAPMLREVLRGTRN